MQDDNTTQPVSDDNGAEIIEPTLTLGSNPSDQQQSSVTDDIAAASSVPAPDDSSIVTTDPEPTNAISEEPAATDSTPVASSSGDLESIRTAALDELTPIVSELDQEPEDKYRTLMMMIQASDKEDLVKDAYDAAHQIADPKAKAEALLNIVNEINYFTSKKNQA